MCQATSRPDDGDDDSEANMSKDGEGADVHAFVIMKHSVTDLDVMKIWGDLTDTVGTFRLLVRLLTTPSITIRRNGERSDAEQVLQTSMERKQLWRRKLRRMAARVEKKGGRQIITESWDVKTARDSDERLRQG